MSTFEDKPTPFSMEHRTMTSAIIYSEHAQRRLRQRGITRDAVDAVFAFHDRAVLIGNGCRAVSLSRTGQRALVDEGIPSSVIERTKNLVLVMREDTNLIVTMLHSKNRAGWSYRRQGATRKSAA